MHNRNTQRFSLVVLIAFFVTVQLFGIFAFPGSAKAQLVVSDPALLGLETTREVKTTFTNTLLAAGLGALINGASYFMRKLAYDTASFVASGGKGQGALAFKDGFGEYLRKEGLNSASSAIEQIGAPFGLNLCKPPDIRTQVFLQVGLRSIYDLDFGLQGGPQPACKWSDFSRDWGAALENPGAYGKDLITENFAASINVSQTDFGVALGFQNKVDRIVSQGQVGASNERLEGQGFKSLTGLISGQVKTPAQVISEETKAVTAKHQGELSAGQIAGIYGSGAAQILPMAAGVFLNTLVSQLLNNLLTGGLFPDTPGDGTSGGTQGGGFGGQFAGPLSINRERAEAAFSFLFTAVPTKELSSFNIAQLAACPDSPGIYNCVIDTAFQQVIDRARTKPLTIAEAIAPGGGLNGNKPLISPRREVDNTDIKGCRDKGYCYSNLQKLRKLRIVPLGFEIAALNADPDNLEVWTLKKVVDSFEDCARDPVNGAAIADPAHPFCHLIDPNWIIKAPDARCEAEGYGNQLAVAGGAERLKECLDVSTCVKEGPNDTCEAYSYCTREKNVWKIPGKACAAYNATCRTYVDDNNQIASYLSRTLDFGECTAESVGCRAYSAEQRAGAWQNSNQAQGQAQLALKALGRPQTVYFNDQIQNQTCPSTADGCSAFYEALPGGENGTLAYFKKAPDYLGCYDIDPRSPEINFPNTEAELALLRNKPAECANFSSACIPEEVACELYTPEDGGVDITGIVGGNVCASECVGYDAYKQEATNFESSKFPMYFVPSNGRACEARNAGCDEFTNLDNPRGGGELREYYSDLKYCEKPAGGNGKTFYSWEGSEREGYVLRRHTLLQISEAGRAYIDGLGVPQAVKDAFPLGSPAYYDDSPASLTSNHEICNQANYNILVNNPNSLDAAHPDCRALYDDQGAVSYRMLTKTVTVSDQCHRLRKTESELYVDASLAGNLAGCDAKGGQLVNNQCQRCFNGGRLEGGEGNKSCVYKGIVAESASCPQSANQCRSYIGNTGNNIQEVYFTSFEPVGEGENALNDAKLGWDIDARVRPEATQVGLYSLEVSHGSTLRTFPAGTFEPGAWYELSFWAKGVQQNFQVALLQNGQEFRFHEANLSFGPSWREYRVGPVQFTGNANQEVILSFVGFGGAVYYLDNVRLTKFTDHIYLIKNSWRTTEGFDAPLTCDSIPNDGFPGEALGCRAYRDSAGERVTFTGFEKLCRAEAVGCRPFYDTKNTIEEIGVVAFNLWCRGNPGTCTIGANLGSCEVPQGERGCYVEKVVLPADVDTVAEINALANAQVRPATIIIPADTPPNDPVYLARRQEFICSAEHLGCQKVALEEQVLPTANNAASYQFSDTYLKAGDPKHYETTLCSDTAVGCGEFKSANEIVYFKDPRIVGNKLCAYVPARGEGANLRAGWYLDGVGKCSNNPANLCRANEDCGGVECSLREPVACYPDYVLDDNEYGIWSQRTPNYAGYVGQCPLEENGCSEFLDPADVSDINPSGKPYFVIADEALNRNVGECNSSVSQKEGCVLFDRTDLPNKLYDAQATYAASENAPVKFSFVSPVSTQRNNTNVILKVDRDRECSEWLDCKTSLVQRNPDTGRATDVCYELKSCRKLGPGGECLQWVDTRLDTERLNEDKYVTRNTSWYGEEYGGYSLFNKYNPSNYINVSFEGDDVFHLAYKYDALLLTDSPERSCTRVRNGILENKLDFETICGPDIGGRCYKGECVYPIDGIFARDTSTPEEVKLDLADERGLCKAHPESSSPYSYRDVTDRGGDIKTNVSIVDQNIKRYEYPSRNFGFEGAYICNDTTGDGCSCEYKKVTYKSGVTDYWSATSSASIPIGVCVGGDKEGVPCNVNQDCVDVAPDGSIVEGGAPGVCSLKKNENQHFGLRGFCLEYDRSRPLGQGRYGCLTWLPVDASATKLDNYNNVREAGYDSTVDAAGRGQMYCTDSNAHGMRVFDDASFISLGAGDRIDVENSLFPFLLNQNQIQTIVGVVNSQKTIQASVPHSLAGERNPFSFAWMHDRSCPPSNENCSGRDYVNLLYSFTQWAVWGNGEWANNESKGSNALVTHVADLNQWIDFHDGMDKGCGSDNWPDCYDEYVNLSVSVRDGVALGCRQAVAGDGDGIAAEGEDCGIPNANKTARNLRVNNIPAQITQMIPPGISLREDEVMGVYYTPFVVLGGLSWSNENDRGEIDNTDSTDGFFESLYLTDKVGIDMDALRAEGVFKQKEDNYMIDGDPYYLRVKEYASLDDRFGTVYSTWRDYIIAECGDLDGCDPEGVPDDPVRLHFKNNEMYTFMAKRNNANTTVYGIIVVMDYRYNPGRYDAKIPKCIEAMVDATVDGRFDDWGLGGGNGNARTGCEMVGAFKTLLVRDGIFQNLTDNANLNWGRWICDTSVGSFSGGCERRLFNYLQNFHQLGLTQVVQVGGRCTDFSLVNKDDYLVADTQTRNKAWTDRAWAGSPVRIAGTSLPELPTVFTPRGSLPLGVADFSNDQTLRLSTFANKSENAIPYACTSPLFLNMESAGVGDSLSCVGLPRGGGYTGDEASPSSSGFDRLNKLFIAGFRRVRSGIENTFDQQSFWDLSGNAALYPEGIVPHIYSLNPFTCFGDSQDGNCSAAEANSFTINKKNFSPALSDYDGDGLRDEDHNRNNVPDPIIERQSAAVALNFFAFADDNRMPIRRVKVDFGDDFVINEERMGLYKNRKPFCSPDTAKRCAGTQLTCKEDRDCTYLPGTPQCTESPPHFGDSIERSCQNSYFEFTHQYTCQEGDGNDTVTVAQLRQGNGVPRDIADIAREAADRLRRMTGVEEDTPVCVFRPKVQILDNWGWCNGGCIKTIGGPVTPGCYSKLFVDPNRPDRFENQCDYPIVDSGHNPWTEYKGAIFVIKG